MNSLMIYQDCMTFLSIHSITLSKFLSGFRAFSYILHTFSLAFRLTSPLLSLCLDFWISLFNAFLFIHFSSHFAVSHSSRYVLNQLQGLVLLCKLILSVEKVFWIFLCEIGGNFHSLVECDHYAVKLRKTCFPMSFSTPIKQGVVFTVLEVWSFGSIHPSSCLAWILNRLWARSFLYS